MKWRFLDEEGDGVSVSVYPQIELGYVLAEGREDEWRYGLAAAWPVLDGLELLGEVHGDAAQLLGYLGLQLML